MGYNNTALWRELMSIVDSQSFNLSNMLLKAKQ